MYGQQAVNSQRAYCFLWVWIKIGAFKKNYIFDFLSYFLLIFLVCFSPWVARAVHLPDSAVQSAWVSSKNSLWILTKAWLLELLQFLIGRSIGDDTCQGPWISAPNVSLLHLRNLTLSRVKNNRLGIHSEELTFSSEKIDSWYEIKENISFLFFSYFVKSRTILLKLACANGINFQISFNWSSKQKLGNCKKSL